MFCRRPLKGLNWWSPVTAGYVRRRPPSLVLSSQVLFWLWEVVRGWGSDGTTPETPTLGTPRGVEDQDLFGETLSRVTRGETPGNSRLVQGRK